MCRPSTSATYAVFRTSSSSLAQTRTRGRRRGQGGGQGGQESREAMLLRHREASAGRGHARRGAWQLREGHGRVGWGGATPGPESAPAVEDRRAPKGQRRAAGGGGGAGRERARRDPLPEELLVLPAHKDTIKTHDHARGADLQGADRKGADSANPSCTHKWAAKGCHVVVVKELDSPTPSCTHKRMEGPHVVMDDGAAILQRGGRYRTSTPRGC